MIKLIPLRKPKNQYYYVLLSFVLIFGGIALVFNGDYSKIPNEKVTVLTEPDEFIFNTNGAPEYIVKAGDSIEVCRLSRCSGYYISSGVLVDDGKAYSIPSTITLIPKLDFAVEHQEFNIGIFDNNTYLCSDKYCWSINEGVNNIIKSDAVLNSAQLKLIKLKW
ncbi:hypothetical protein KBD45_07205 [Candidatus Dojkabacteria bacterium]|nr:hypothetical protein [Candidatus Dojkabacteria bacterium]